MYLNVFPDDQTFLGLDISHSSTGVALVHRGELLSANITLTPRTGLLAVVEDKEELKNDLESLLAGKVVHHAVVEDVFFGGYVTTYRQLVNLSQVLEELIVEQRVDIRHLVRVQSGSWKSWIRPLLADVGGGKGDQGKVFIQKAMAQLGVEFDGKGFQDRLDALAMIVGLQLMGGKLSVKVTKKDVKSAQLLGDKMPSSAPADRPVLLVHETRLTMAKMLSYLNDAPGTVFLTSEPVSLGFDRLHINLLNGRDEAEQVVFWQTGDVANTTSEWFSPKGLDT